MAIDYTTDVGMVRLIVTDVAETEAEQLLSDDQIGAFLAMYGDNVNRAAAKALRTIAASEVLVSKKITTQDLSADGPAVSKELRALADSCIAEAEGVEMDDAGFFEFIPNGYAKPEGAEARL